MMAQLTSSAPLVELGVHIFSRAGPLLTIEHISLRTEDPLPRFPNSELEYGFTKRLRYSRVSEPLLAARYTYLSYFGNVAIAGAGACGGL